MRPGAPTLYHRYLLTAPNWRARDNQRICHCRGKFHKIVRHRTVLSITLIFCRVIDGRRCPGPRCRAAQTRSRWMPMAPCLRTPARWRINPVEPRSSDDAQPALRGGRSRPARERCKYHSFSSEPLSEISGLRPPTNVGVPVRMPLNCVSGGPTLSPDELS
jgi:hypothetical protein